MYLKIMMRLSDAKVKHLANFCNGRCCLVDDDIIVEKLTEPSEQVKCTSSLESLAK